MLVSWILESVYSFTWVHETKITLIELDVRDTREARMVRGVAPSLYIIEPSKPKMPRTTASSKYR